MNALPRRTCYRCGKAKSLSRFTRRRDGRFYEMCRSCVSEILERRPLRTRNRLHHTATHRTCYLCTRFLTVSRFTRRTTGTYFSRAETVTDSCLLSVAVRAFLQLKVSSQEPSGKVFTRNLTPAPIASAHGTIFRFYLAGNRSYRRSHPSYFKERYE
jgi:hypothetical protein